MPSPEVGVDFPDLLTRILSLIPGLSYRSAAVSAEHMEVEFDGRCGGLIERHWPQLYALCRECGCHAHFEWVDGLITHSVLDTASPAPVYTIEPIASVRLLLTSRPAQQSTPRELKEVA